MSINLGEFDLIDRLIRGEKTAADGLVCGGGDDCAIIAGRCPEPDGSGREGNDWLVTTDALVESVHFRRAWCDMHLLGRKALSVNASDIAAMGGVPKFYLVAIGLPDDMSAEDAIHIYDGMKECACEHGMILVGGDTVASKSGLILSMTAIGEVLHGRAIMRSGARPGDAIFVTGNLGGAALGFHLLERDVVNSKAAPFIRKFLNPSAKVEAGRWISETGMATSMIDLSDGLISDMGHIADASGVGFEIAADEVPMDENISILAREIGKDPVQLVLTGGEDYELLFTIRGKNVGAFEGKCPGAACAAQNRPVLGAAGFRKIGVVLEDKNIRVAKDVSGRVIDVPLMGFDHFRKL